MKTSEAGMEMEASAQVDFRFTVGKFTVAQAVTLDLEDLFRNPEEIGDFLRSCFIGARSTAAREHRETAQRLADSPPAAVNPSTSQG